LSRRRQNLHALAWSLPDVQPAPRITQLASVRGESPGAWQLCDPCDGTGTRRGTRCTNCRGAGRYRVDPVTLAPVAAHDSHAPTPHRTAPCDRCAGSGVIPRRWLDKQPRNDAPRRATHPVSDPEGRARAGLVRCPSCDGCGRLDVPHARTAPAPALLDDGSALARLRAQGDWHHLEAALHVARTIAPDAARAWTEARQAPPTPLTRAQGGPTTPRQREVSQAVLALDSWLVGLRSWKCPLHVVVAYAESKRRLEAVERARRGRVYRGSGSRTLRIRDLAGSGMGCEAIAVELGCSASTVTRALRAVAA
jgi:hypothetical protein